ncbi:MAG: VirB4 family type IV secretion/conjugal transfer ATPase, partial [Steroidobacteraceae bacterium]
MSAVLKAALRRELSAAERIPYTAHVADEVVRTGSGDYVQVMRLAGASFESADDERLNAWHERLNVLWRNIASPQVALWSHIVRRRERAVDLGPLGAGFAGSLEGKYRGRLALERLMVNELYLALVYRPAAGIASGLAAKLLARSRPGESELELADSLDACEKLRQSVVASLSRYEPEVLGVYSHRGRYCSSVLEFFAYLLTLERSRVPLPRGPASAVLASARLSFGLEAIEYRTASTRAVGAMLGIKEYPTPTAVGMFNRLLSAPLSFILTQSFSFLSKAASQG